MSRSWVERGRLAIPIDVDPPDPPDPPDPLVVGMPLGTEVANVGPTANLASNTLGPKAYNTYGARQDALVINDADAVIDDLNVHCVLVNAPRVKLRRPLIGQIRIGAGTLGGATTYAAAEANAVQVEHGDIGHVTVTPDMLALPEIGSGSDRIVFDNAGALVESSILASGASIFTRCNMFGSTDISNSFGTTCKLHRLVENWCHSTTFLVNDPNRGGNTSHQDFVKVAGGGGVEAIRNVVHAFPALLNENRSAGPYYRTPHFGAAYTLAEWPAVVGGALFAWTGYWNVAQQQAVTNVLLDGNRFSGPAARWVYFLQRNPWGHVLSAMTRNNQFLTAATAGISSYLAGGTTGVPITAADRHYWFNNTGPGGAPVAAPRAGIITTDADWATIRSAYR